MADWIIFERYGDWGRAGQPHPEVHLNKRAMTKRLLTLDEFCREIPEWYDKSIRNEYQRGWIKLLARLPMKATQFRYFDMQDLCDIAIWGGNQHGIKQRMQSNNTPEEVKRATSLAIAHLDDPAQAMREIARLKHWGVAYCSKTLTFMCPSEYAILDSWIRKALSEKRVIPTITDGNVSSVVKGYGAYLECCRALQRKVAAQPPVATTSGQWRIADIGQSLFEFARSGGIVAPT